MGEMQVRVGGGAEQRGVMNFKLLLPWKGENCKTVCGSTSTKRLAQRRRGRKRGRGGEQYLKTIFRWRKKTTLSNKVQQKTFCFKKQQLLPLFSALRNAFQSRHFEEFCAKPLLHILRNFPPSSFPSKATDGKSFYFSFPPFSPAFFSARATYGKAACAAI